MRRNVQVYVLSKEDNRLLMLKRVPSRSGYWQPVCGGIEAGELEIDAAVRELEEETGIRIQEKPVKLPFRFGYSEKKNGVEMEMEDTCYLVGVDQCVDIVLSEEHERYVWCELDEIKAYTDWNPINEVCSFLLNLVLE